MARLEERDGKVYCIEEDGTEWEYSPPEPGPELPPDRLSQLEIELSITKAELSTTRTEMDDMYVFLAEFLFG